MKVAQTVKELRDILADIPDHVPVVITYEASGQKWTGPAVGVDYWDGYEMECEGLATLVMADVLADA